MNVTDDATLNHTSPGAIDAPIVGAGATTTIEGFIGYEQLPFQTPLWWSTQPCGFRLLRLLMGHRT